jgi:hypothetical protein
MTQSWSARGSLDEDLPLPLAQVPGHEVRMAESHLPEIVKVTQTESGSGSGSGEVTLSLELTLRVTLVYTWQK